MSHVASVLHGRLGKRECENARMRECKKEGDQRSQMASIASRDRCDRTA